MMNKYKDNIVVLVTTKDAVEASQLAKKLVEQKLVACASIIDKVKSVFWWKDKVEESREALLILKTNKKMFKILEEAIKLLHSYEVPEIIALPIILGNDQYLKWVNDSVR